MPTGTFFAVAPFKVMTVWLKIDGGPAKESCMTVCGLEYEDPRILVPDDSLMNINKLRIKEEKRKEEEEKKKKRSHQHSHTTEKQNDTKQETLQSIIGRHVDLSTSIP